MIIDKDKDEVGHLEISEIKQRVLEDVDLPTKRKKRRDRRRSWLRTILEFSCIIVVIFVVFRILIGMAPVEGDSMYPTLHDKDTVFYYRLTKTYLRGDVVAIEMPGDEMYVKRVLAVAGDTVNMEEGKLYINGKELKEPWVYGETNPIEGGQVYPVTVKEGEIFVLGDNREISDDSRVFGAVQIEDTGGKLLWYAGTL